MFFPGDFFGGLFFILPMVLLAGIFVTLMIVLVSVIGRRRPDPLGRRAEAAYLLASVFSIGLAGLAAIGLTADAIGKGIAGTNRCQVFVEMREGRVRPSLAPGPEFTIPEFPEIPEIPDFQFTFQPIPQPEVTVAPASVELRPQPIECVGPSGATAQGVHGGIYLVTAAAGVVWFGNRARELVAKEKSDDA